MLIYPAIDLKDGQCVRLVQGRAEDKTVYGLDPAMMAKNFERQGAEYLHVVDLDGAFKGEPGNLEAVKAIARSINIPFQVGGGLRSHDNVRALLECGAARVIIGTRAVSSPDFIQSLIREFGPERIVVGIDARDGMVAIHGWVEVSELQAVDFGRRMKKLGIKTTVFTDVSRDGLLQGPNLDSIRSMALETGLEVIASGGVSSRENIRQLKTMESLGVKGAVIGKALYEGRISLTEALEEARL